MHRFSFGSSPVHRDVPAGDAGDTAFVVHLLRRVWSALAGGGRGSDPKASHGLATEEGFDKRQFERRIRYRPRRWELFFEALLHRSALPLSRMHRTSNERLEFLGDAVLGFLVAEHLHTAHPALEEGDLTKLRSRLVNRKILADRAREMQLPHFLFLSASARQSLQRGSESILSDAFEALVGAVYVDGGIAAARTFVQEHLLSHDDVLNGALTDDNYKSALLEYAQSHALGIPRYATIREEGPDHDRLFTVEVSLGADRLGEGTGKSKKDAEQAAAFRALGRLQRSTRTTLTNPPTP